MIPTRPVIGISVYRSAAQNPPHIPLYALHPLYSEGVVAGGGAPVQIPLGLNGPSLRAIFERVDGLLLSGGGDVAPALYGATPGDQVRSVDRERDELEIQLVRWALASGKPLFAICRGHQVLNVALGGTLYQDVGADMPGAIRHTFFQDLGFPRDHLAHEVQLAPDSYLTSLLGRDRLMVNSLHHQGIKELAPDLAPIGHAPDGLVEAVQVLAHPFALGVQWHPEALVPHDPMMRRLFEALVEAARDGRRNNSASVQEMRA